MKGYIKSKPGLYLYLAKQKGYQVIEFTPSSSCPIFNLDCSIFCKFDSSSIPKVCPCDGSSIAEENLYADHYLQQFSAAVRIDLIAGKFLTLPIGSSIWQKLPDLPQIQSSHLKYAKLITSLKHGKSQISESQLLQIEIFHNFSQLPAPASRRSFLSDQRKMNKIAHLQPQCSALAVSKKSNHFHLFVGDRSLPYLVPLLKTSTRVVASAYDNQFLAIVAVENNEKTIIFIFQISAPQVTMIHQMLLEQETTENHSQPIYSVFLRDEHICVLKIQHNNCRIWMLPNLMSSEPEITEAVLLPPAMMELSQLKAIVPIYNEECQEFDEEQNLQLGFLTATEEEIKFYIRDSCYVVHNQYSVTTINHVKYEERKDIIYFVELSKQLIGIYECHAERIRYIFWSDDEQVFTKSDPFFLKFQGRLGQKDRIEFEGLELVQCMPVFNKWIFSIHASFNAEVTVKTRSLLD